MIFLGDIASPNNHTSNSLKKIFDQNKPIFLGKRLIINFEGVLNDGAIQDTSEPILWNHSSVLSALNLEQNSVFCLANNHVLDLPIQFRDSMKFFQKKNIHYCGVGYSREAAEQPIFFEENGYNISLFNYCWDFLLYNNKNPKNGLFVAELNEEKLIKRIKELKGERPELLVAVYIHWSFDLEILPFPMYRQFARDLIEAGCNIVIGSHAHCVQGGEVFKDGYILYGLGNFFIPNNEFIKGKLKYPEFASIQLALEWDPAEHVAICHWFKYYDTESGPNMRLLGSERFENSKMLKKYSEFQNMSDMDYFSYYKKYRRKKLFIPVYTNYKRKSLNKIYTVILKQRARFARSLAKLGLRKWLN